MTKKLNTKHNKSAASILEEFTTDLIEATEARDAYEIEYEVAKAKLMVSAEIDNLSNQPKREAEIINLLDKKGMYRKMAELKMHARLAWYKWASIKSLIDGKESE
jgi:hypothetical protein